MSPDIVSFALRALLRLGNAGNSALAQYARDKAAIFPDLKQPEPNLAVFVAGFFADPKHSHFVTPGSGPYAEFWTDTGPDLVNPRAVDSLYIAIVKIQAEESVDLAASVSADSDAAAGLVMIEQWADSREPVGPLARVLVTVADVALEYVAGDPSISGIDGRGEQLLAAFARSLADRLPDDGNFGPRDRFAERLFAVALRAGLETVSGNTDVLLDGEHLRRLLDTSLPPVIDALPDSLAAQLDFRRTLDSISGPALGAAMRTMAEYQEAFLGDRFDATTALGAVTQALLMQAADTGFAKLFSRGGLEEVYTAALGVAATRPELFVRDDGRVANDVARQLLGRFAAVLRRAPGDDRLRVGPELGAAVLGLIRDNVQLYARDGGDWESLAADLLDGLLGGLEAALGDGRPNALQRTFSREQMTELGRLLLNQVAATPSMIVGGNAEVQRLMAMVASLVAADENLSLTGSDWLAIAAVIFDEAAANPGRLFDAQDGEESVAAQLIRLLLNAAAKNMRDAGRAGGAVLFGATLREAVVILLGATAGNAAAAAANIESIADLVIGLSDFVSDNAGNYGSRDWLALFGELLLLVLDGEPVPVFTADIVNAILEGEPL